MDFTMGADVDAVRVALRALIDDEIPPGWLGAFSDDPADLDLAQRFCRTLASRRLLCPAWPADYGGHDASLWEQTAVREEMWAHHEPRGAQYMGVNWVGPTLLRHGTAAQQHRHLPSIARGEVIWCQGFSEPDSGSDLASLRTAARREGDRWRITGQKIWTSYATMAQWCFLLARTSTEARKQAGLTIFLVPMDAPGITVRPIATMLGPHHLNEVFFDDVEVDDDAVLGEVGDGWSVVREVLAFERVGIARYARVERLAMAVPSVYGDAWQTADAGLAEAWAEVLVSARAARLLAYKVVAAQDAGALDPADAAAYRIAVTTLDQVSADVLRDLVDTLGAPDPRAARFVAAVEDHWKYSRAATVSSGSIEMQKILLARTLTGPKRPPTARPSGKSGDTIAAAGMNLELSEDARLFGVTARDAFEAARIAAGSVPGAADSIGSDVTAYDEVIAALGVGDLRAAHDPDEAEAAAALCQAAGWAAVERPLAARLADDAPPVVSGVSSLEVTLGVWTLSGHLDRAMALACAHVVDRQQFDQPLAAFQGVQFALADAEVARARVAVLARYALWSVQSGRGEAFDDALAARLGALRAARVVFGATHQVHGAIGFCDETLLSWVSRVAQPLCRHPWPLAATSALLAERIRSRGLVGLFDGSRVR